jgi:hypothetical protein
MSTTTEEMSQRVAVQQLGDGGESGRNGREDLDEQNRARAEAFEQNDREMGTARFPELESAYRLGELSARFAEENLREAERAAFAGSTRAFIVSTLRKGELVLVAKIEEAVQTAKVTRDRELRRDQVKEVELGINRGRDVNR